MSDGIFSSGRLLRRLLERAAGPVLFGLGLLALGLGRLRVSPLPSSGLFLLGALGVLLGARLRRLLGAGGLGGRLRLRLRVEIGAALILLGNAAVQLGGGTGSLLAPLRYAGLAALLSYYRGASALLLGALALGGESLLLYSEGVRLPERYLLGGALVVAFAALRTLVLRGELWRQRSEHRRRVADAIAGLQRQAHDFRLLLPQTTRAASISGEVAALSELRGDLRGDLHGPAGERSERVEPRSRADEEVLLLQSAVVLVRQNLDALVGLLKRALGLHTCAVLWLREDQAAMEIVAATTDSEAFSGRAVPPDVGIVGTVLKTERPLCLRDPKPSQLPYYDGRSLQLEESEIAAVCAVPLVDGGRICGVLLGDRARRRSARAEQTERLGRSGSRPGEDTGEVARFTPADEAILAAAAPLILRALQSERVFIDVERRQYSHERLLDASRLLNAALKPSDVHAAALDAVAEICRYDFAALTRIDELTGAQVVVAAAGDPTLCKAVQDLRFSDGSGLCAMAVRLGQTLPPGGQLFDRDAVAVVFDERVRLRGYASLAVVPLSLGPATRGALVVAGRGAEMLAQGRLELLQVLANQIAVSLDNARMVGALEAMATTDGLTGLLNRRAFNERFAEMQQRAERMSRELTVVLCDIDHFKKINDTYGHLVGDEVLRRVAGVVGQQLRKVDLAARYGGEEFALVLEATAAEGGRQLAERVRAEIKRLAFAAEAPSSAGAADGAGAQAGVATHGAVFGCTLSLGIATFPGDGRDGAALLERADQALYYAKRHGRDQAVAYRDVAEAIKSAA
ncbi:MAG: diguanylate cyclase [Polyangia bacterium]